MDKLNGHKRKILKYIYSHQKQKLNRFNILDKFKFISREEVELHISELHREKYISYYGLNDNIKLTSKGLSYFSNETQDSIETCVKSIFCPIIVSFLTTIITLWLKGTL